jgi:hypothetical protein
LLQSINNRPFSFYLLFSLLILQALSGIFGGLSLTLSPSGKIIHIPLSVLDKSPFGSFLVPGMILLILLGLFPAFVSWAMFVRPKRSWLDSLNIYRGIHWTWTYSLYLGIMLVIFILFETLFIGYDILQIIYGLVGIGIIITALLPSNMSFYGWKKV